WRRPGIQCRWPRRTPEVKEAKSAGAVGRDEHLEPVAPDRGARIAHRAVQLKDQGRATESVVATQRAHVDIEVTQASRVPARVEVRDPGLLVLEDGRGTLSGADFVDERSQIRGRSPSEVVIGIRTMRNP